MALGPIPWTAIVQWCEFRGLDRDASMILIHVIRQLDADRSAAEASRRTVANATGGR